MGAEREVEQGVLYAAHTQNKMLQRVYSEAVFFTALVYISTHNTRSLHLEVKECERLFYMVTIRRTEYCTSGTVRWRQSIKWKKGKEKEWKRSAEPADISSEVNRSDNTR